MKRFKDLNIVFKDGVNGLWLFLTVIILIVVVLMAGVNRKELKEIKDIYSQRIERVNVIVDSLKNINNDSLINIKKRDSLIKELDKLILSEMDTMLEYNDAIKLIKGENE